MSETEKSESPKKEKLVKIKALRPIQVGGKIIRENDVVSVTEEEAHEFCDKKFEGYIPAYGYLPETNEALTGSKDNPMARRQIVRAVRVS